MIVFGGFLSTTGDFSNELWLFEFDTKQWKNLSSSSSDPLAIYGTQGISSRNNRIGARAYSTIALKDGNPTLYVFGGRGYSEETNTFFNVTSPKLVRPVSFSISNI
jgi:hypothetical protein